MRFLPRKPGRLPDGVTSGLANWWPLSLDTVFGVGSPLDFGALPLYGTPTGAGVGLDPQGPFNSTATSFDGSATAVIQLSAAALNSSFAFSAPHSIFLWVKLTDINAAGRNGASATFLGLVDAAGNKVRFSNDEGAGGAFFVSASASAMAGLAFESTYGVGPQISQTWAHLGYIWDGTTSVPYGNGVALGKQGGANFDLTVTNCIGAKNSALDGAFSGSLADVRIYNRALSADEVARLYYSAFQTDEVIPALYAAAGTFVPFNPWPQAAPILAQ